MTFLFMTSPSHKPRFSKPLVSKLSAAAVHDWQRHMFHQPLGVRILSVATPSHVWDYFPKHGWDYTPHQKTVNS